jgi:ABC-2 type transport system permease protein
VSGLITIYRAQFSLSLLNWLQYRIGMLFWFIVRVVEPLIYISVWSSIANNSGGTVNGLTTGDIAAYYIVIMVVNQMTFLGLIGLWGYRVKTGALSNFLLRPVSIFHRDLANLLANKAITLTFIIPTVVILSLVFLPRFNTTPLNIIGFFVAVVIAFCLRFMLESVVGMVAFWLTHMDAVERLYSVTLFFFSGRIAPLLLLPVWMQQIANILPFRWILSFPTEILLGRLTTQEIVNGFVAQDLWLVSSYVGLVFFWRAAVQRYSSVDG